MVKPRAISHVLLPRCRLAAAHIQELPGAGFDFDLFAPHHATCNCVQQIPKQREAPPCGLPKFGNLTAAKLLLSIYAVPGLRPVSSTISDQYYCRQLYSHHSSSSAPSKFSSRRGYVPPNFKPVKESASSCLGQAILIYAYLKAAAPRNERTALRSSSRSPVERRLQSAICPLQSVTTGTI